MTGFHRVFILFFITYDSLTNFVKIVPNYMKKNIVAILVFCFFFSFISSAQDFSWKGEPDENGFCKVAVGGGYAYEEVYPTDSVFWCGGYFFDLRPKITFVGGKYGFADKEGKIVIPTVYDSIGDFIDGVAWFCRDGVYGYLSMDGSVLDDNSQFTCDFKNGVGLILKNGRRGMIDRDGKTLIDFVYTDVIPQWNNKVIWANTGGLWMQSNDKASIFVEGGKWSLLNWDGQKLCSESFDHVGNFAEGLAYIEIKAGGENLHRFGVIDCAGNIIVKPKYTAIGECYSDGAIKVCIDGKWGMIDRKGNEIVPCIYEDISDAKDGFAAVAAKTGKKKLIKWGFVDMSGKLITEFKYDKVGEISEGMAAVFIEKKWGFVNSKGELAVPLIYAKVRPFSEGLAAVGSYTLLSYWGYVDKTGKEVIPTVYTTGKSFSEGLAAVSKENKKGLSGTWNDSFVYIDRQGNVAIPFEYGDAGSFVNGKAEVVLEEHSWKKRTGNKMFLVERKKGTIDREGHFTLANGQFYSLEDVVPEDRWTY